MLHTPGSDGVYLGDHTHVGGFIARGKEFTYTREATPDSIGIWPYHDHGPGAGCDRGRRGAQHGRRALGPGARRAARTDGLHGEERSLRDVGGRLGLSGERVRQIERRALPKLADYRT